MQKMYTLLAFIGLPLMAFSQSPFTITADNFPVFDFQFFERTLNPANVNLTPDANANWDFSALHSTDTVYNPYFQETDPFYTDAGIDVYLLDFKNLNANLGYEIYYEYDFDETGVYEKGIYLDPQAYSLSAFTGNPLDSLKFPFQKAVYSSARKMLQFPATYQSAWQSSGRRVVNFSLSVQAAGLNNTPCQHVYTLFRSDTIVGWGKMRVYSGGSPSVPYDVLIERVSQFAVDSFFVNGAPAPAFLTAAFGIAQGQQSSVSKRYVVYREGFSTPLSIFNYGTNNYTTPTVVAFDIENLTPTTGVETPLGATFSTLMFPNPSSSGELTLQLLGEVPAVSTYVIHDQQGRTVQNGAADLAGGELHFQMNNQLPNGNYVLQVLSDKKQTLITEKFVLAR